MDLQNPRQSSRWRQCLPLPRRDNPFADHSVDRERERILGLSSVPSSLGGCAHLAAVFGFVLRSRRTIEYFLPAALSLSLSDTLDNLSASSCVIVMLALPFGARERVNPFKDNNAIW